jgi:hypothetical protein
MNLSQEQKDYLLKVESEINKMFYEIQDLLSEETNNLIADGLDALSAEVVPLWEEKISNMTIRNRTKPMKAQIKEHFTKVTNQRVYPATSEHAEDILFDFETPPWLMDEHYNMIIHFDGRLFMVHSDDFDYIE